MRATAQLLWISRNAVRRYLTAGGSPRQRTGLRSSGNGTAK